MFALKPEGPKPQLANFFRTAAQGFEFLSMWFSITKQEQEEILRHTQVAYAKSIKEGR